MADEEFDFAKSDAGVAETTPKQCSALRKGDFAMLKNQPCKLIEMSTSKTGKHGHAKVHMVGLHIFDGKKYEDLCPSTHNMNCPTVVRKEYQAIDMNDEFLTIVLDNGDTREDIKCDPGVIDEVRSNLDADGDCMVTVLKAMGKEKVISCKPSK